MSLFRKKRDSAVKGSAENISDKKKRSPAPPTRSYLTSSRVGDSKLLSASVGDLSQKNVGKSASLPNRRSIVGGLSEAVRITAAGGVRPYAAQLSDPERKTLRQQASSSLCISETSSQTLDDVRGAVTVAVTVSKDASCSNSAENSPSNSFIFDVDAYIRENDLSPAYNDLRTHSLSSGGAGSATPPTAMSAAGSSRSIATGRINGSTSSLQRMAAANSNASFETVFGSSTLGESAESVNAEQQDAPGRRASIVVIRQVNNNEDKVKDAPDCSLGAWEGERRASFGSNREFRGRRLPRFSLPHSFIR
jgi:hypothetical protein